MNYSCIFRHIQSPGIRGIFRNLVYSEPEAYETNIMIIFNAGLIFTPEVFIPCKKVWWPR